MSAAAHLLGVPEWLQLMVRVGALALGLIMGLAALRAAAVLFLMGVQATWEGVQRLTFWLSELAIDTALCAAAAIAATVVTVFRALSGSAQKFSARLTARLLAPFLMGWEAMRQRQELRRIWANEYRDQFPTFAAFLDAFARGGRPRGDERQEPHFEDAPRSSPPPRRDPPRPRPPPPPPPPDPKRQAFIAACRVLGVPDSGVFTLSQLNLRYRALISANHPDRGGNAQKAAAINAARDLIKSMKGWT